VWRRAKDSGVAGRRSPLVFINPLVRGDRKVAQELVRQND